LPRLACFTLPSSWDEGIWYYTQLSSVEMGSHWSGTTIFLIPASRVAKITCISHHAQLLHITYFLWYWSLNSGLHAAREALYYLSHLPAAYVHLFEEPPNCFPQQLHHFTSPVAMFKSFSFSPWLK
jgi:hypothetical protein